MRNILFSCFSKTDQIYTDYLQMFLDEAANYKNNLKVEGVLTTQEIGYLNFIIKSFQIAGETPSQNLFEQNFPESLGSFTTSKLIPITDLRVYIFNVIDGRVNKYITTRLAQLNTEVRTQGITEEIVKEFNRLDMISNRNKSKEISIHFSACDEYVRMKQKTCGMITGIKEVDDRIGGMNEGTVTTIAGFTSQFKTTWALNIAYLNAYNSGYNTAYLSLETPKNDMRWNLVSRHSYSDKFNQFPFIPHDKMRRVLLTADEEANMRLVEDDLESDTLDREGNLVPRGMVTILDESDFNTFSFGEITSVLEKVDDELNKEGRGGLDCVIVDYVQLCKFSGTGITSDANSQINSYITFFRRLGQNFRRVIDANGNEHTKQLVVILLAQLNRTGWVKASRNNGRYDLTALADANELERGSSRIFTTFTTEEMKARNSAQVQILKNRQGQTMTDPSIVFVEPAAYVFCDDNAGQAGYTGAAGLSTNLNDAFNSMDNMGMDMSTVGLF